MAKSGFKSQFAPQAPKVTPTRKRPLQRGFRRLLVLLGLLFGSHVGAMVAFEGMTVFDAVWLTMTTLSTVGYGDLSAETIAGRLSTMLLLFLGGIWVAFQAATLYFDERADRRERMQCGRWRWNMHDHILILNNSDSTAAYLVRLLKELRASSRFRDAPIQIVTLGYEDGLPEDLTRLGAVHYSGEPWDPEALAAANAMDARVVVVLSHADEDPASDGRTFDIVSRLREMGCKARILAECVIDANRPRIVKAGADILVRPLRGYPEMIVRALAAPGAEKILEDLFNSAGDECWRYDVAVSGWPWAELVTCLVNNDVGTPIGFRVAQTREVKINPPPDAIIEADKLYVLVRDGNERADAAVGALLPRR